MAEVVDGLRGQGLHPSYLPLGMISPGEPGGCILCSTCNSFPCQVRAKSDTDVICVTDAVKADNVTLWTGALAERLLTDASGNRVEAVEVMRDGERVTVRADTVVLSAGRGELLGAAVPQRHRQAPQRARPTAPTCSAAATWRTSRR